MDQLKTNRPCGTWPAEISAELITRGAPGLNFLHSDGHYLYWVESRPWDGGRNMIMRRHPDGSIEDLLPSGFSHHSRVHEYGGKAYAVADNLLYFVNAADQRIYQLPLNSTDNPIPLTLSGPRFADLVVDSQHRQLIAVCEVHSDNSEPQNYLAAIPLDGRDHSIRKLVSGADFYAYPDISPDGQKLSWIQWCHPHMPWDCTQLWQASLSQGEVTNQLLVAGGSDDQAIFQPRWSPDNRLFYVSDRSNWWNLHCAESGMLLNMEAEFATPLWQLGMSSYDFIDANTLGCLWVQEGIWHSGTLTLDSGELTQVESLHTHRLSACCHRGALYMVAGAPALADQIISLDLRGNYTSIYCPADLDVGDDNLATPESIRFASADGREVQGFFYPPTHSHYRGEDGELPPAILICHGGPTGATHSGLNLKIQFWTNRGFAVMDINYRGSSGFGRQFRQALDGAWGIADVQDTQYAIKYLVQQQRIDGQRCIIRGSSAGGYTVLSALTFTDSFKAGASLYGIGDLETLARDTHKFESRYLDKLVGPYPQAQETYIARSPIYHTERLNCPVIFLQGLEDQVVPPNQAQRMVNTLKDKGIEVAYITFADEGHGFRKAENIIHGLESELRFYQQVFKLDRPNNP